MRVELAPALILHRRAWRDTSFLIEAFSREHGRVGLVAKGARRAKARWRGLLEPLADLRLSWSGRGELFTLTGVEVDRRYDLHDTALWAGFYASELVLRLTAREDAHPRAYDSLRALLQALADGAPAAIALRFFERDLLDETGYGVPLTVDSETGSPIRADVHYAWHPERGLRQARAAGDEVEVAGAALIGLTEGRFTSRADVRDARRLLAAAIEAHLGGRPLKTLQTMRAMRQFRGSRGDSANKSD